MDDSAVRVPVSLLLDTDLPTSAKVVWMVLRLHPAAGPAQVEAGSGLSRGTVLRGLARVAAYKRPDAGPRVKVPGALLADRTVGSQAKVLYGLLQSTPDFRGQSGRFTYPTLCALTRFGPNTLKRAMADLVAGRWIRMIQTNRLRPIEFTLGSPDLARSRDEAITVQRRLKRAKFGGEAIMQEYLSLLIDSDQFTDNARPGFLVSPLTRERLELDRFYPAAQVAFEFHGLQHDRATGRFSQDEVDAQRVRDLIKAGICLYQGIHLVIVRAGDLSLEGMLKRIGGSMPIRDLAGHEPLIDLLEKASLLYRAAANAAERAVGQA